MEHLSKRILWQKLKRLSLPTPRILIELKKHSVVTSIPEYLILYRIKLNSNININNNRYKYFTLNILYIFAHYMHPVDF